MRFGIRELIFFAVLLAMPLSSYWFVFRPQNDEIAQARKEIEQKEAMLEKLAETTRKTADLERANNEIADGIATIEARLPGTKDVEVILEQVADLARQSDLQLPKVRAQKPVPSARYMEQPLDMTIHGDFDDFYEFMLSVEKLERITRIPDMKISRSDKEDGATDATFTLSIYFQPDGAGGS